MPKFTVETVWNVSFKKTLQAKIAAKTAKEAKEIASKDDKIKWKEVSSKETSCKFVSCKVKK